MKLTVFPFLLLFSGCAVIPVIPNDHYVFKEMLPLAEKGDPEALYYVGMLYQEGLGVDQDYKKAFEWFQKSAAANDPLGAFKVACYYHSQGEGIVTDDPGKAFEYDMVAAKAGYAPAQFDIGNFYYDEGNFPEAVKWWKVSADQGFPRALFNLSTVYFQGKAVAQDLPLAYAYFKLSKLTSEKRVNPEAQKQLDEIASKMSRTDLEQAGKLISDWNALPTPLTSRAMEGMDAAREKVRKLHS